MGDSAWSHGSRFPVPSIPDSRFPIPDPAYGALVASQFALPTTESGFEASMTVVVPTNFPSFIRPTARNITFPFTFGIVGSLYGFDVAIMLSASSFVLTATATLVFVFVRVAVESLVLFTTKAVVVVSPSTFDVPFHVPLMSAAVRAGGAGGGGGGAGVVVSGAGSFLAHATTNRAKRNTLRIDASWVTIESAEFHAGRRRPTRHPSCSLGASSASADLALPSLPPGPYSRLNTAIGSIRAALHAGIQLAAIATTPSATAVPR